MDSGSAREDPAHPACRRDKFSAEHTGGKIPCPLCVPQRPCPPGTEPCRPKPEAAGAPSRRRTDSHCHSPSGASGARPRRRRPTVRCRTKRERMLPAPGLQVAICGTCQAKLDGPEPPPPLCAFNEVHPLEFRPGRGPADARGGAPSTTPVPGGPVPWGAGADAPARICPGNQDGAHREIGLKGAGLAPIGRNSGKSVLSGCDLRPLTFTGPTRFHPGRESCSPARPGPRTK